MSGGKPLIRRTAPAEPVTWCGQHPNRQVPCPTCDQAEQYDGDLLTPPVKTPPPLDPLTRAFIKHHKANPQILQALLAETRTLWRAGVRKCAIATIYEVVRWRITLNAYAEMDREATDWTPDGGMIAMSNSHRAYYVRLIEHLHPVLVGFFITRASEADNRTDEWIAEATR